MLKEVQDFLLLLPQWCVMLVIVAVHCVITFCLKVPGCPTYVRIIQWITFIFLQKTLNQLFSLSGYLGPGGLHDDAKHFDCVGGAAGYIDRMILKEPHLHHSATVYKSGPYDPEGILGIIINFFSKIIHDIISSMLFFFLKVLSQRHSKFFLAYTLA